MAYSSGALSGRVALSPTVRAARCSRPLRCRIPKIPVARAVAQEQTPQQAGTKEAENQLEALKAISLVVADTGEIDSIRSYKPVDCTTNPSLVLKAVQNPAYHHYLETAMAQETDHSDSQNSDRCLVNNACSAMLVGNLLCELDRLRLIHHMHCCGSRGFDAPTTSSVRII